MVFIYILQHSEIQVALEQPIINLDAETPSVSGDHRPLGRASSFPLGCHDEVPSSVMHDLTKVTFQEFFFHAVPLVVHPIIILRVLCHKMFGHMLRRKIHISNPNLQSTHNLSPPLVIESDSCPPRPPSSEGEVPTETPNSTPPNVKKKKQNVHVQITMPTASTEAEQIEEAFRKFRRTRRAGSMDKHLLRLGSLHRKNATMSLAIKAIADSLVTPLDLNISPPPRITDLETKAKRNIFRFPSMKKRISKSYGYLAGLGQSLDEETLQGMSSDSLNKEDEEESRLKEFQKELINLPTYEVDTHRMDQSTSPLLSRSNSVPDHLGGSMIGLGKSPAICQISVTANEDVDTIFPKPLLSIASRCKVGGEEDHEKRDLTLPIIPPRLSGPSCHTIPSPDNAGSIIVHFASATPMESPASNVDPDEHNDISPLLPCKSGQNLEEQLHQLHNSLQQQPPQELPPYPQMQLLTVNTHLPLVATSSSSSTASVPLSPTTTSFQSEFTLRTMTPSNEVPSHHLGVMKAVEIWVTVCCIDLESNVQMKREMKDFLSKMSSLGAEYKSWSQHMNDQLSLEVR